MHKIENMTQPRFIDAVDGLERNGRKIENADNARDRLKHFDRYSGWLDTRFKLPGTGFRFGIDGILGLIPGVGDAITAVMGLYAFQIAQRENLPLKAKAGIVTNIGVDMIIGSIPLVGDLFDFAFRAHRKNYQILEKHLGRKAETN